MRIGVTRLHHLEVVCCRTYRAVPHTTVSSNRRCRLRTDLVSGIEKLSVHNEFRDIVTNIKRIRDHTDLRDPVCLCTTIRVIKHARLRHTIIVRGARHMPVMRI